MIVWLRHLLGWMVSAFSSPEDLILENLALRQQLLALHAKRPRRRLTARHKLFWVALRTLWSGWMRPLVLVTPRTVVSWHRAGFRLYWAWVSRARQVGGRKRVSKEVRALIFRMVEENPTWGAPRIHGELLKLGFDLSERNVSRWVGRAPRDPDPSKRWLTFLRNHRVAIAAIDLFIVPTLTFGFLYCFFVISHDGRNILHFNVTRNPNTLWVVQRLREAWVYKQPHRFLLFDRDSKFGADVVSAVRDIGSQPTRTAFRSPWQNGVAERWVGSCRRDLLDHVVVLNERHLKRLMAEYVRYYHALINFERLIMEVREGYARSRVTKLKSEYSQDEMPLDPDVAAILLEWKQLCPQSKGDWVFPSPRTEKPYDSGSLRKKVLKTAALRAKISGAIGWHTLRHSYRAWLDETGAPLGVQQRLMRHANISTTMNIYGGAFMKAKREANTSVVQRLLLQDHTK